MIRHGREDLEDLTVHKVNNLIKEWQQGDCVLGGHHFLFGYNPKLALSPLASDEPSSDDNILFAQEEVIGFTVVTQTCDIIRNCEVKPYVEMAPLCEAPPDKFKLIKKHLMPGYAAIPALENKKIVADLDRTMTVQKPVLAKWSAEKMRGCRSNDESISFAWALGRKRTRFPFPDNFVKVFNPFLKRIRDKHGKNTDEGKMLSEFKEIFVRSAPDWSSQNSTITFFFFVDKEKSSFTDWSDQTEAWKNLIRLEDTSFSEVEMLVVGYDEITAQEYRESMPLDLDGLSANENLQNDL